MDTLELLLNAKPSKLPEKDYKSKRLSEECGGDVVFKLRALPFSRVAEIRKLDDENQSVHIILAGVVSPDLKTPALLQKYDAVTPAELVQRMFLPGELDELALCIEQLCGYRINTLEEVSEVKKNSEETQNIS